MSFPEIQYVETPLWEGRFFVILKNGTAIELHATSKNEAKVEAAQYDGVLTHEVLD